MKKNQKSSSTAPPYWLIGSYVLIIIGGLLNLTIPLKDHPFSNILFKPQGFSGFASSFLIVLAVNPLIWAGLLFRWYIHKAAHPRKKSPWVLPIKIYGCYSILILFLSLLGLLFNPYAKKNPKDALRAFMLKDSFEVEDVGRLVESTKSIKEFNYYFDLLNDGQIFQAQNDVYKILRRNWSKEELYKEIQDLKEEIAPLVSVYAHMEDHKTYLQDPKTYPAMNKTLWEIFFKEFELSILGIAYKANFDPAFSFGWDEDSYRFAQEFRLIVNQLQAPAAH